LIAVLVSALAAFVLLPITSRSVEAAGVVRDASTWAELRDAITDSQDGDIVEITKDIVASTAKDKNNKEFKTIDLSGGKTVTIRAKDGKNYTIRRDADDADFPMFKTSNDNAKLILGDGLTLTGETCGAAPAAGEFKVVFHNGGEGDKAKQTNPVVVNVGESIVKDPADIASDWAPETGLVFKGWKFIGPGGNENNTSSNTPNTSTGNWKVPADKYGTMTLVAQWEKAGSGERNGLNYNGKTFYRKYKGGFSGMNEIGIYGGNPGDDYYRATSVTVKNNGVYYKDVGEDKEYQLVVERGALKRSNGGSLEVALVVEDDQSDPTNVYLKYENVYY
jgi:hypothetical protein